MNNKKQPARSGKSRKREYRISVHSERRTKPDMRKLARAVIEFAAAQEEADAKAQQASRTKSKGDADVS
ncbi:hypothetical protein ACFCV3_00985 [Kribbella sp. NPDC056345]|uniref:hypothetical protein n=1 Tax=Kribbella sp. NPDC056345 TaxID=3345789 RepID=UPI0035DC2D8C